MYTCFRNGVYFKSCANNYILRSRRLFLRKRKVEYETNKPQEGVLNYKLFCNISTYIAYLSIRFSIG